MSPEIFVVALVKKKLLFFNEEKVEIIGKLLHFHLILEHRLGIFVHVKIKHETEVADKCTEVNS